MTCRMCFPARWSCAGTGIAEVTATGAAQRNRQDRPVAQHAGNRTAPAAGTDPPACAVCAMVGGAVSVLAVLLYGTLRGGWLDALLAGIALGMSMLPEEFPVVLTVSWRWAPGGSRGHGADPARGSHRDTRLRDRAVHRQDRHA